MIILTSQQIPEIEYPEEDGQGMPEGDEQREYISYATKVLQIWFQDRSDIYVSGNLFVYYEQGNREASVSPDTFVVIGADKYNRGSYKLWEEDGKSPDFVLEITSASTVSKDRRDKPLIYRNLGVKEYFQYDPSGKFLKVNSLQGMHLEHGKYVEIPTKSTNGVTSIWSDVLNLELRLYPDRGLRFYDPILDELLRSHEEEALERSQEKQARLQAEMLAEQERSRAEHLAAYLRTLGINPDEI
jgi:Uma2 family endonuclease